MIQHILQRSNNQNRGRSAASEDHVPCAKQRPSSALLGIARTKGDRRNPSSELCRLTIRPPMMICFMLSQHLTSEKRRECQNSIPEQQLSYGGRSGGAASLQISQNLKHAGLGNSPIVIHPRLNRVFTSLLTLHPSPFTLHPSHHALLLRLHAAPPLTGCPRPAPFAWFTSMDHIHSVHPEPPGPPRPLNRADPTSPLSIR